MRSLEQRARIDRIENILIALLTVSALVLVGQTGVLQVLTGQTSGPSGTVPFAGIQGNVLSRGDPMGILVQNQYGRYGLCYDQTAVNTLWEQGLDDLLNQAVAAMEPPKPSTQEAWEQAVAQEPAWVCWDFQWNIPFSQTSGGEGEGRLFLLTGRGDVLHYYNQETGEFYSAALRPGAVSWPDRLGTLAPNGAKFAFEDEALAAVFPAYVMVLPLAPACPVYTASNPLTGLDEAGYQTFLEALDLNLRAATVYESVDGTVIREGADTLRIQEDGTVIFHGSESGQSRWQALSQREKDQQIKAEELLDRFAETLGAGTFFCQNAQPQEDGSTVLTFCYLLNGSRVQLWDEGWAARFVFQGQELTAFELRLRHYEATGETSALLPQRQAAAAAEARGQSGKELQLCYQDAGDHGPISAGWTVRDQG